MTKFAILRAKERKEKRKNRKKKPTIKKSNGESQDN